MVVVVASVSFLGFFSWETAFFLLCGSIVVVVVVGSLLFRAPRGVCVCSPYPFFPPLPDFPLSSLFLTSYRVFVVNLHLYVCSLFFVYVYVCFGM